MFTAGFLAFPDVQTNYSGGSGGKYRPGDYVWGDRLGVGHTATQYDPFTYEVVEMPLERKGVDNLANFLQGSHVLNNSVSISQRGELGSIRTSFTHVNNKGQYPNTMLNKYTASVAGDVKVGNFTLESGITYNKRSYPNNYGTGYGGGGYLYNLIIWSGAEYDIRDYRNYWVKDKEGVEQNWMDKVWYSNPYYIANEILQSDDYDILNGFMTANYQITPWLNAMYRTGVDSYSQKKDYRNPIGAVGGWNNNGYYAIRREGGYSLNNDVLITADKQIQDFVLEGLVGASIYYTQYDQMTVETQNGLTIPEYYSIYASVDPVKADQLIRKKQVNSLYGKASISWRNGLFVDVTGRNDWSSTLRASGRSYFYPSVSGSFVLSEFVTMPRQIDMLKFRGSWTQTKEEPGIFEINNVYGIDVNVWDGLTSAYLPTTIRGEGILPQASRTYEFGGAAMLFRKRLQLDVAYYNKRYYDQIKETDVSDASGFSKSFVNINEEVVRKGVEVTVSATPLKRSNWQWDVAANWAKDRRYYHRLDDVYSSDQPWVKEGARYDWMSLNDYDKAPDGQIIHNGGYPVMSRYASVVGYSDPDWMFGVTNTVRWNSLTLSFTVDGRVGGTMFNQINQAMWNSGSHIESDNQWRYDQVMNGFNNYVGKGVVLVSGTVEHDQYGNVVPGTDTRVFAPNEANVSYESYMKNTNPYIGSPRSQNYYSPTFIKLRDLAISYHIPSSVVEPLRIKSASISLVGQNLLLWTKSFKYSDPDKESEDINSPSIRYVGANLRFTF